MQTKAYFANSIPAAFEKARELGENALLVGSKPTGPQARQFGALEVTFAWDPHADAERHNNRTPPVSAIKSSPIQSGPIESRRKEPAPARASSETDEIRRHLSALRVAASHRNNPPAALVPPIAEENRHMVERLVLAGFSPETAMQVASGASRRAGDADVAVVDELAGQVPTAPFVEMKSGESRTLAFIGPPGRGKTTSLVKIAWNLGLARRIPVRIYCAGAHSIGAAEQMARFAAILGAPFQSCESLASLNLVLNGQAWKGLSLIDTPGISPADRNELVELKEFFSVRPEIEKHLVLRADASSADMGHMVFRFSGLTPSRLLFTGMDEAVGVAAVIETLIRERIPATFAGTGQEIPDDLETLNAGTLARAVWKAVGLPSGPEQHNSAPRNSAQAAAA